MPRPPDEPGGGRAPDEVPLTPVGWLVQNGIYLAILVVGVLGLPSTPGRDVTSMGSGRGDRFPRAG